MSYKVLVRDIQFFNETFTIGDVYKHFAERADLKTISGDLLFYSAFSPNRISVITKPMCDKLKQKNIPPTDLAIDHMDTQYPFIKENQVDDFVKTVCTIDTPVVNDEGIPQYVIMKGYQKTDRTEHFICNVLSGLSTYDLSVNADMTVSCGCMLRKAGQIGDLRKQTLQEIYSSEYVAYLRKKMYEGFLPSVSCFMRCCEIMQVPSSLAKYYLSNYSVPKGIMFENTSICNLRCKGCYNAYIDHSTVSLEDTKKFAEEVNINNISSIFLFKYGESFCDKEINKKIDIIKSLNPNVKLHISTNGTMLDRWDNIEAALKLDYITFSLDGVDDKTVSGFQQNGSFEKVYSNICKLIEEKDRLNQSHPFITWKYVLFPHNHDDNYINKAFDLAAKANVDVLSFVNGFNTEISSGAIWKSDVFLNYMNMYKFRFTNSALTFTLKN